MIKVEDKKVIIEKKKVKQNEQLDTCYIGEKIKTTKDFIFGKDIEGVIRLKKLDFYGIELTSPFKIPDGFPKDEYPHTLRGILKEKNGYILNRNCFEVIDRKKYSNPIKQHMIGMFKERDYKKFLEVPEYIKNLQQEITRQESCIYDLEKDITRYKNRIIENTEKVKQLKELKLDFDYEKAEKEFDRYYKTKKIHKISITENYFVVTTKNLVYRDKTNSNIPPFNLGRFKIFIPFDKNASVRAVNITRQLSRGYYGHPCLENRTNICLGSQMHSEIHSYFENDDYYGIVLLLINFFEEPMYDTPYRQDYEFYCAQPVDVYDKITNEEDWLNQSILDKCSWDDEKFNKESREAKDKFAHDCPECGETPCICEICQDCGHPTWDCSC